VNDLNLTHEDVQIIITRCPRIAFIKRDYVDYVIREFLENVLYIKNLAQIRSIIRRWPFVLTCNVKAQLHPQLHILRSYCPDPNKVRELVVKRPKLLGESAEISLSTASHIFGNRMPRFRLGRTLLSLPLDVCPLIEDVQWSGEKRNERLSKCISVVWKTPHSYEQKRKNWRLR
jgi:hypothetical protein